MLFVQTLVSLVHDVVASYELHAEALPKQGKPKVDQVIDEDADGQ